MDLKFQVRNQKLEKLTDEFIVNEAHNYHTIFIDFVTPDWNNRAIFVILKDKEGNAYRCHYTDNGIKLAHAIVKDNFSISCYGMANDESRITTNELSIWLNEAGYTEDIIEIPPEEMDIIADIYLQLDTKSDKGHDHTVSDITDFPNLSEVALSGRYDDLSNKPYIPVKTSDLTNDGDGSNAFVKNNDSRLSDTRNPKPHTHSKTDITDFPSKMPPTSHTHTKSEIVDLVLSTVAVTGNYGDLKNKPSIPTKISDLTNDSNFVQKSSTRGFIKNDGSIAQTISVSEVIDEHSEHLENIGISFSNAEQYQVNRAIDYTCYNFNNRLDDIDEILDEKADITYVDNLIGEISEYVNR